MSKKKKKISDDNKILKLDMRDKLRDPDVRLRLGLSRELSTKLTLTASFPPIYTSPPFLALLSLSSLPANQPRPKP